MARQYWLRGAQGATGPFDADRLADMASKGMLTPATEVSADAVTWEPARSRPDLFPSDTAAQHHAAPTEHAIGRRLGNVLAAMFLLYVGGWFIAWGLDLGLLAGNVTYTRSGYALVEKNDIYFGHGVAFLVNGAYYGVLFGARFFNAPVISFALFFLSCGLIARAVR